MFPSELSTARAAKTDHLIFLLQVLLGSSDLGRYTLLLFRLDQASFFREFAIFPKSRIRRTDDFDTRVHQSERVIWQVL